LGGPPVTLQRTGYGPRGRRLAAMRGTSLEPAGQNDLVAHCGQTTAGFFLHTLCAVDIATGWVELQPVWGKGHRRVTAAIHEVRGRLPVPLRGLDTDNVLSARARLIGGRNIPVASRRVASPGRDSERWPSGLPLRKGDPAAHNSHRVRARAGPALTVLNTAWGPSGRSEHYLRGRGRPNGRHERDRSAGQGMLVVAAIRLIPLD